MLLLATSYAAATGLPAEIIPAQIQEFVRRGVFRPRPDGTHDFGGVTKDCR
jgi:hypothetical protein